jgi:hypothetical protein
MALTDEKCMMLTTYRKSGEAVATPVWLVDLGGNELGFWTSSVSGKAKRIAHTSRVTVQPCTQSGKLLPGYEPVEASARVVVGDELEAIRTKVVAKYGIWTKLTKLIAQITFGLKGKRYPYADRGVVITLPS